MAFLKKVKVERATRVKGTGTPYERASVDLSLNTSEIGGVKRDMFTISHKKFDEIGLGALSVVFTDVPFTMTVTVENSELATSLLSKREHVKTKSNSFASPELITSLETAGTIPATREIGFKANFKLELLDVDSDEYAVVTADADEAGLAGDIVSIYAVSLVELTTFVRKPRVKKEEVATQTPLDATIAGSGDTFPATGNLAPLNDGDSIPASAFGAVESFAGLDDE